MTKEEALVEVERVMDLLCEIVNANGRAALDEIADSFEREADAFSLAQKGETFDDAFRRVDQARAAATYVRCVRDTRFPK